MQNRHWSDEVEACTPPVNTSLNPVSNPRLLYERADKIPGVNNAAFGFWTITVYSLPDRKLVSQRQINSNSPDFQKLYVCTTVLFLCKAKAPFILSCTSF